MSFSDRGRGATVAVVLLVVLILRVPAFFDYSIVYENRCPPFQDYMFVPYLTAYDDYIMYNFYVMTILQIFLPFVLLFVLNIVIILLTRRRLYQTAYGQHLVEMPRISLMLRKGECSFMSLLYEDIKDPSARASQDRKFLMLIARTEDKISESINKNRMGRNELKYATWTMVAIVFTYLICNSFSLFISVMENVFSDSPILVNADGSSTQFYTITADLISILVALNSLLRLVIYLLCNPQFRLRLTRKFLPSRFDLSLRMSSHYATLII
ncbi:unnamed protein product [Toxocara canis]|uniref:G_PROTEIN_RECEP_F1_2 domain-containing protein n=1 Tax=Toxocara canis TaxID=6265 RepID=A0A183UI28_TOXCA|nr:unnamed protein product [Toxocara canis]